MEATPWLAILLATVASMVIGAVWYSTLSKPWIAAAGFTEEQVAAIENSSDKTPYVVAAIGHLVMAWVLAGIIFHSGGFTLSSGIVSALLVWLGFIATSMSVNHRFQFKPWSLTAIDAGHYLAVLLAQGAIIGSLG